MHAAATPATLPGIVVSTAVTAGWGGGDIVTGTHAEGILVTTAITAGGTKDGTSLDHVEGVVAA